VQGVQQEFDGASNAETPARQRVWPIVFWNPEDGSLAMSFHPAITLAQYKYAVKWVVCYFFEWHAIELLSRRRSAAEVARATGRRFGVVPLCGYAAEAPISGRRRTSAHVVASMGITYRSRNPQFAFTLR
jgi:hypothetical protein